MQALLLEQNGVLCLREVAEPQVGLRDVLVRVSACGICGSDVHGYDGSSGRRVPPLIMGHEAAGIVARVGSEVQSFRAGDTVTFDSTISCGRCNYCGRGAVNLCDNREVLGVSCMEYRRDGAFAEYVSVPEHILYRLPPGFPLTHAALIEAVSVAVHAAKISEIRAGNTAVVIGSGMIGLLAIQAFRHFGCATVFAVDLEENRLALARRMGADATFVGTGPEVASALRRAVGGVGLDIAVDAVGLAGSVLTAIASTRRGGTVTLIGNLAPQIEVPLQTIVTRELRLLGSCASAGEYPECIALMQSGAIIVEDLISAVAPLREGAHWFERLHQRETGLMKVILEP